MYPGEEKSVRVPIRVWGDQIEYLYGGFPAVIGGALGHL